MLYDTVAEDAERARAQAELKAMLELNQGVPTARGRGRSGLRYKVHGLCHSERLKTVSWKSCATHINSTFTFVGDLGEKNIIRFKSNLRLMFGDWLDRDMEIGAGPTNVQVLMFQSVNHS